MKEFYFKEHKNQIYFFFRSVNNNSADYDSWKKDIDNKIDIVKPNHTFKKLLKFLKINNTIPVISQINNSKISIWESDEYRFIEFIVDKISDQKILNDINFENIIIVNNIFYCIIKKGRIK